MNRLSVSEQNVDQNLQIEIENYKLIFIPVRPTRSNISLKVLSLKVLTGIQCVIGTTS